jgi:hypothetical protein
VATAGWFTQALATKVAGKSGVADIATPLFRVYDGNVANAWNAKTSPCQHCGELYQPANIVGHERTCVTPRTVERVLEMGGLTQYAADNPEACWEWPVRPSTTRPYRRYGTLGRNGPVHRVVLEIVLGRSLQRRHNALHTCDNPPCVNPAHLYEGTQSENMQDVWDRDRRQQRVFAPEVYQKGWETRRKRYGDSGATKTYFPHRDTDPDTMQLWTQ